MRQIAAAARGDIAIIQPPHWPFEAREDIRPERVFVVYSGDEGNPPGEGIEAIGLGGLAAELAGLGGMGGRARHGRNRTDAAQPQSRRNAASSKRR